MHPKESLEQSIEHFREIQNELIERISNLCNIPREKIILNNYQQILAKHAPWYLHYLKENSNSKFIPEPSKPDLTKIDEIDEYYYQLIEKNPVIRDDLIREFFSKLSGIEASDIDVLFENLKNFSNEQLKMEFSKLKDIFK